MDNVRPFSPNSVAGPEYGVEFLVFEEGMRVYVEGRRVPHLAVFRSWQRQDGETMLTLVLDGRMSVEGSSEEVKRWIRFVADSMAVAAGYSCFGEHSAPVNPFKPGMAVSLGTGESNE